MEDELHTASSIAVVLILLMVFIGVGCMVFSYMQQVDEMIQSVEYEEPAPAGIVVTESTSRAQEINISRYKAEVLAQTNKVPETIESVPTSESNFNHGLLWGLVACFIAALGVYIFLNLNDSPKEYLISLLTPLRKSSTKNKRVYNDYYTPPKTDSTFGFFLERGSVEFSKPE